MMIDPAATARILERLRVLGVKVAIDDFGTGYCSLGYLERFAVSSLKIDQSFVAEIQRERRTSLADTILRLADSLQIPAVAEGIEDPAQLAYLRDHGCAYGQGFYLARPMPARQLATLLDEPLFALAAR